MYAWLFMLRFDDWWYVSRTHNQEYDAKLPCLQPLADFITILSLNKGDNKSTSRQRGAPKC